MRPTDGVQTGGETQADPAIGDPVWAIIGAALGDVEDNLVDPAGIGVLARFGQGRKAPVSGNGLGEGGCVPQADLPKLGRRFYRGPDAPPGGSGLGLSIVETTATEHDLVVTYGLSPLGGLRVTLAFVSPDTILAKPKSKADNPQ